MALCRAVGKNTPDINMAYLQGCYQNICTEVAKSARLLAKTKCIKLGRSAELLATQIYK